jgi:3-oxoacid CoA-transferase
MGGAMDLVAAPGTKTIITMVSLSFYLIKNISSHKKNFIQEHNSKNGGKKILTECSLPLTGKNCVDMIITEKAVFTVDKEMGLTLSEIAPDITMEELIASTGCSFKISDDICPMKQV